MKYHLMFGLMLTIAIELLNEVLAPVLLSQSAWQVRLTQQRQETVEGGRHVVVRRPYGPVSPQNHSCHQLLQQSHV